MKIAFITARQDKPTANEMETFDSADIRSLSSKMVQDALGNEQAIADFGRVTEKSDEINFIIISWK